MFGKVIAQVLTSVLFLTHLGEAAESNYQIFYFDNSEKLSIPIEQIRNFQVAASLKEYNSGVEHIPKSMTLIPN